MQADRALGWCWTLAALMLAGAGRAGAQEQGGEVWSAEQREALAASALVTVLVEHRPEKDRHFVNPIDRPVQRAQPGFLIGSEGLLLTRASAFSGATKLAVEVGGEKGTRKADILGQDATADLVLLRLAGEPRARIALPEAALEPFEGERFVLFLEPVSGQRAVLELASEPLAAPGRELHHGGLPLIDDRGRLAGVTSWSWPKAEGGPQALNAAAVKRFVEKHAGGPSIALKDFPASAESSKSLAFPLLRWGRVDRKKPLDGVIAKAVGLPEAVRCPNGCGGTGSITDKGKTNRERGGRVDTVPTSVTRTCEGCQGAGLRSAYDIWKACRVLASELARLDPRDAQQRQRALEKLEEHVSEAALVGKLSFLDRLDDGAHEELKVENLVPGRAVCFSISHGEWARRTVPKWEMRALALSSGRHGDLLLHGVAERNVIGEGQRAFVTGVVAGFVTTPHAPSGRYVVLESCLVVPVKKREIEPGR